VVEDDVGKILYDFAHEKGHARSEIAEPVDHEVARPVPAEQLGDAGWCESPRVAIGYIGLTRLTEGAVASSAPPDRRARKQFPMPWSGRRRRWSVWVRMMQS
jgi:hypothetical protein